MLADAEYKQQLSRIVRRDAHIGSHQIQNISSICFHIQIIHHLLTQS